jgi:hypothetical protein
MMYQARIYLPVLVEAEESGEPVLWFERDATLPMIAPGQYVECGPAIMKVAVSEWSVDGNCLTVILEPETPEEGSGEFDPATWFGEGTGFTKSKGLEATYYGDDLGYLSRHLTGTILRRVDRKRSASPAAD